MLVVTRESGTHYTITRFLLEWNLVELLKCDKVRFWCVHSQVYICILMEAFKWNVRWNKKKDS